MVKKYIMLAFQIINMGGEQQFCRNKLLAMEKLGYSTTLFSCEKGNIVIEDLKKYSENCFAELRYPPFCFTKKRVNRLVNKIVSLVGDCTQDSIVESVNPATAEWGELIAKELGCRHICFMVDEAFSISQTEFYFFKYKYNRKEINGTGPHTLKLLFQGYMDISEADSYFFDASCTNVVEDTRCNFEWFEGFSKSKSLKIGSIGRLEKGYLLPCLKEIKQYILNKKISADIVLIGGTNDKRIIKKIRKLFAKNKNINIYITNFLYPIPESLIKSIDVFFATSGSAIITAVDYDRPTISVDTFTGTPIGILNYTTDEILYSDSSSACKPMDYYLDQILFKGFCKKSAKIGMEPSKHDDNFVLEVEKQIQFTTSHQEIKYFDVSNLSPSNAKYRLYQIMGKLFGPTVLSFFHLSVIHRIKMLFSGNSRKTSIKK